jgi:hypothetical protein
MKKVCSKCGKERDAEQDFNWKIKGQKRQAQCKFCQSQTSKRHYQNNKQLYSERVRTRDTQIVKDNQKKLTEYLLNHPYADCSQADIRVLEFDHVRGNKSGNISRMIGEGYSWPTIEAEIAKCEVRCANCHRIKECERRNMWRQFSGS